MIHSKSEIIAALNDSFTQVIDWYEQQEEQQFIKGPEGKWNAGQHLAHLIKGAAPVNKALTVPKFLLTWKFGKPNRAGRTYDALINRYHEKLKTIPAAFKNPFTLDINSVDQKTELIENFKKEKAKMNVKVGKWQEEKLDQYLVPHPLLGKLSIREILFFTAYHNLHHLKVLQDKY